MSEITVANTDWNIAGAVKTAVSAATIDSSPVFQSVTVAMTREQAMKVQLTDSPVAIVLYDKTAEDIGVDDERNCVVSLTIILAARLAATPDESARLQEILRLKNAAVNAVEDATIAAASAVGAGDFFAPPIKWQHGEIDTSSRPPWMICRLPVKIAYRLSSPTSH